MKYRIAVVAGIAALAGVSAAGAQDSPRTIELVSVEQRCGTADNGRRGDSLGDLLACRGSLRGRTAAGRSRPLDLRVPRRRAPGEDCTATVNLARRHAPARRRAQPHEPAQRRGRSQAAPASYAGAARHRGAAPAQRDADRRDAHAAAVATAAGEPTGASSTGMPLSTAVPDSGSSELARRRARSSSRPACARATPQLDARRRRGPSRAGSRRRRA